MNNEHFDYYINFYVYTLNEDLIKSFKMSSWWASASQYWLRYYDRNVVEIPLVREVFGQLTIYLAQLEGPDQKLFRQIFRSYYKDHFLPYNIPVISNRYCTRMVQSCSFCCCFCLVLLFSFFWRSKKHVLTTINTFCILEEKIFRLSEKVLYIMSYRN